MITSQGNTPSWSTITSMCVRILRDDKAGQDEQMDARKQLFHIAYVADKAAKALATDEAIGNAATSKMVARWDCPTRVKA